MQRYQSVINQHKPLHHAIYKCGNADDWQRIESQHRRVLAQYVLPNDSVLDVGCGWGRLAYLLPTTWRGDYLGIDITPEFLSIAQQNHPDLDFARCDVSNVSQFMEEYEQRNHVESGKWDWAV